MKNPEADAESEPELEPGTDAEAVEWPITGELDLHAFRPNEIGSLLPEYFRECQKRGILTVRVIHGKGTGALRVGTHALLEQIPSVISWEWPAGQACGSWGATWVWLKAPMPGEL